MNPIDYQIAKNVQKIDTSITVLFLRRFKPFNLENKKEIDYNDNYILVTFHTFLFRNVFISYLSSECQYALVLLYGKK